MKNQIIFIMLLLNTSCCYSKNFGRFYAKEMSAIDTQYGDSAIAVKVIQTPFYGLFYLYGGIGSFLDVKNWDKEANNKVCKSESNSCNSPYAKPNDQTCRR